MSEKNDWYDEYQKSLGAEWQPTQLTPDEEQQFRSWLSSSPWYKEVAEDVSFSGQPLANYDLLLDLTGPQADYDYRGAWKKGVQPALYEHDNRHHWPSSTPDGAMLKSPHHPTAWMEYFMRETGTDPNDLSLRNPEEARDYTRGSGQRRVEK